MGLDAKQLNHLTWGAHTTGNIFTTAPHVRWFNYWGTYYMHVCMCELQLQIIHITHFDMYYFGLIGPRQCSVAPWLSHRASWELSPPSTKDRRL